MEIVHWNISRSADSNKASALSNIELCYMVCRRHHGMVSGFQMTVEKPTQRPITTGGNSVMNKSGVLTNTCNLFKAREKSRCKLLQISLYKGLFAAKIALTTPRAILISTELIWMRRWKTNWKKTRKICLLRCL